VRKNTIAGTNPGNPSLLPTLSDNIDVLVEHYIQPLGIIQGDYFFKELSNPIYPVASLIPFDGTSTCTLGAAGCRTYQLTQSINGPNAHIQGIEFQWEQRFSFLPGPLILLCYKKSRRQQGHLGRERARWVAIWRRTVAIEQGLCRSVRTGRAAGRVAALHMG
jgi:TonB dependent receptor